MDETKKVYANFLLFICCCDILGCNSVNAMNVSGEIDVSNYNLSDGEYVTIGDFIIEYHENEVIMPNANTTDTYTRTSNYDVKNKTTQQRWYTVTQVTSYTYNGSTYVNINKNKSRVSVKTYVTDADYKVTNNTITNSGSIAQYAIGVKLKLGSKTANISDVVTCYPNGTQSYSHNES